MRRLQWMTLNYELREQYYSCMVNARQLQNYAIVADVLNRLSAYLARYDVNVMMQMSLAECSG